MSAGTFDMEQLDISIAERGFVIGVSKIGEAIGTGSGERADVSREVTSIVINRTRGVADDLFVSSTPPSCTIGLAFTDSVPKLKNRDLVVTYRGVQLYRGNVNVSSRSAVVDPTQQGGKKWAVQMQSASLNNGSRRLRLVPFDDEIDMVSGIIERLPGVTSVVVSDSVIHRARTFRMPYGAAWGDGTTEQAAFIDTIGRTLSCIVDIDPASPRTVTLLGYDDGLTWQLGDQLYDDPSYSAVQIDEDAAYPTGIRLTALGSVPPQAAEGDPPTDPEIYSASYYEAGVSRNDKDFQVAVPEDARAVLAVLNTLPTFSSLPESVRTVKVPFSEQLDISGTPVRLRLWLDGQLWEATVVGLTHELRPGADGIGRWVISLTLGPLFLITRDGTNVNPVTNIAQAGTAVTWTDTPGAYSFRVDVRTDRWAQYPGEDGGSGADVSPGVQTYTVPAGTSYVTVWAVETAVRYSEARTIRTVV